MTYIKIIKLSFLFCFDFCLFFAHIGTQFFSLKKVHISQNDHKHSEYDFPNMIENSFIVSDKKYTKQIHTHGPETRSDHIIKPEILLSHARTTGNKRNK